MFTGIIQHQGFFKSYRPAKGELAVEVPSAFRPLETGRVSRRWSLLTCPPGKGYARLQPQSRDPAKTNLRSLHGKESLNLELPLTLQTPLSGHLVTGHIDGQGRVLRVVGRPSGRRVTFSFPRPLRPYFVPKGSVAVNGVSLTVAEVRAASFDVELIPLTMAKSNLKDLKPGRTVNLECDIIGKYVYNWAFKE
jgi:riboflavin synthase